MSATLCPFERIALSYDGQRRLTCAWCDRPLTGRQSRWCSSACSRTYARNHSWTDAREAALLRDGRLCRRCGVGPGRPQILAALLTLLGAPGVSVRDVEFWIQRTHPGDWEADEHARMEVNHVVPRRGRGYGPGCHHHLDELETLCRSCHVDVTTAQGRGYRGAGADLPLRRIFEFPETRSA